MNPLLAQFIVEAREQITATTDGLLVLERDTGNAELLNGIFRSVHTLKGSSGLFDFPALTSTLHAAEDLLVSLRERQLVLDPAMLDQILAALDLVSVWLDSIEDSEALPHDAAERGAPVAAALRAWLAGPGPAKAPETAGAADAAEDAKVVPLRRPAPPAWLAEAPESALLETVEQAVANGAPVVALSYRPEAQCFFKGDDPLALVRQVPDRLWLGLEEPAPWPALGDYDPFSCALGFRAISLGPKKEVQHLLRYVAEQAEITELEAGDLLRFAGTPTGDSMVREFAADALAQLQRGHRASIPDSAGTMLDLVPADGGDAPALRWLARLSANAAVSAPVLESLLTALAQGTAPVPPQTVEESPAEAALSAPAARLLREQRDMLRTPCDHLELAGRIGSAAKVAANALRHEGRPARADAMTTSGGEAMAAADPSALLALIEGVLEEGPPKPADAPPAADSSAPRKPERAGAVGDEVHERASTVLRVDQSRIDALMNLIGELVVAKNGLPFLARRAENV
ncbi:Hpt domain-containing protein, partial [Azospirillum sp. SYSU D00513]|uniref:Hpt domain-containing protein n=1 Tax=Azospirillum sp. SYSU D00513 TaxID=2812561 RepID=UPI001A960730